MKILDCKNFKGMLVSAANNLENKHEEIDKLNVFPVPDGDTGTNMKMTFCHAVEVTAANINDFVGDTAKFLSKQMLMGARGNSGVILSQIFKGLAKGLDGLQKATVEDVAKAVVNGSKVAYKAVMRPVEGTILTVCRESAEYAMHFFETNPNISIEEYFDFWLKEAKESLNRTPELLPVLKEVGVVDSGGAGLVTIIEGMVAYLHNSPIALKGAEEATEKHDDGYCVEVACDLNDLYKKEFNPDRLKNSLGRNNDDIKLVRENNLVKLHAHSKTPGDVLNTMQRFGDMVTIKVEKLSEGHTELFTFDNVVVKEHTKYALISVCNGKGIEEHFKNVGVDYMVSGGQTMNPATEDFVNIINEVNADHVIILPNNSNIILAANQAKDIVDDKDVYVLPTKSIPQGISACIAFNFDGEMEENIESMNEAVSLVKTGSVTTAIKDTTYNSLEIRKDDFMGICEKEVIVATTDMMEAAQTTMDSLIEDESGYVTIIYGSSIDEATAQQLLDYVVDKYELEGELISGQQDLYPFVIGVE